MVGFLGPFDQDGMQPDLYIAMANHMTFALKCRRRCPVRLERFDGYSTSNASLLSRYYFYLEAAHEDLDQPELACQAAASYLLFNPKDEAMLGKKKALTESSEFQDEWFAPRPEALSYHQRQTIEVGLLEYIETEFAVYGFSMRFFIYKSIKFLTKNSKNWIFIFHFSFSKK